jgi:glycosyltransferase involved in cell wall biosynthesis
MFGIGGMPKWLYHLAGQLQADFDFTFIATHSKYLIPEYRDVARVVALPFNKWALAAYLFTNRIDIAQVANLRLYVDAARLARVPVIIERVDGLRSGAALGPKDGLDAVIASTRGMVPELEKLIAAERIHMIYNGVDIKSYEQAAPQRFGFQDEDVIIGRTSRLSGGKNISLLIQAVIALRNEERYKHVRLVICGGDTTQPDAKPMFEILKNEARKLGTNVVFTGETLNTEAITAGYDIVTCTSRPNNEGIPNSLIEAMAAGKPVVASAVDDIPELVQDGSTGLLFPTDNLAELTKTLKRLIDSKALRQELGATAKKRITSDFNIKAQSSKYAKLYMNLLQIKGRHPLNSLSWEPTEGKVL